MENEEHRAVFRASTGHDLNKRWLAQGRSLPFGAGIIGWVAATGEHLLAGDISQEPRYLPDDPRLLPDTRSELAVPLKIEDTVVGVLDVQSRALYGFDDDDLFMLNALANLGGPIGGAAVAAGGVVAGKAHSGAVIGSGSMNRTRSTPAS